MTKRELAELILAGRRAGVRISQTFSVDLKKCAGLGLSIDDIRHAENAANAIERCTESRLKKLDR